MVRRKKKFRFIRYLDLQFQFFRRNNLILLQIVLRSYHVLSYLSTFVPIKKRSKCMDKNIFQSRLEWKTQREIFDSSNLSKKRKTFLFIGPINKRRDDKIFSKSFFHSRVNKNLYVPRKETTRAWTFFFSTSTKTKHRFQLFNSSKGLAVVLQPDLVHDAKIPQWNKALHNACKDTQCPRDRGRGRATGYYTGALPRPGWKSPLNVISRIHPATHFLPA